MKMEHKLKKILIAGLLPGLCACSAETDENVNRTEEMSDVALTYCTWEDERNYTDAIVEAFEIKHPGVEVTVEYVPGDYKSEEIAAFLEEHPQVDIMGVKDINTVLMLSREGMVLDLTKMIEESSLDVTNYGNMYNDISIENRYYCLPARSTSWILIYNKDIFEEEKIPYPEQMTWEEYAALAKKLTRRMEGNVRWGGCFVDWVYNYAGIQKRNYLYDDDITWCRRSLELLNQFYNVDKSHPSCREMEEMDVKAAFENGEIAMMPQGEWFIGELVADEKDGITDVNWDIAPVPIHEKQETGTTWGQYQLAVISNHCENRASAFEFLEFLCGNEGAQISAAYGMIPAYNSSQVQEIYKSAVGSHHVEVLFEAYRIPEKPVFLDYTSLEELFENEAVEYLEQRKTLDSAIDDFLKERENFFNRKQR